MCYVCVRCTIQQIKNRCDSKFRTLIVCFMLKILNIIHKSIQHITCIPYIIGCQRKQNPILINYQMNVYQKIFRLPLSSFYQQKKEEKRRESYFNTENDYLLHLFIGQRKSRFPFLCIFAGEWCAGKQFHFNLVYF